MAGVRGLFGATVGGLLCAAPVVAHAQATTGTLTGRVVDSTSQAPISAVTVRVDGTQLGTVTRDDGTFTIAGVPTGARTLRVTRIGFGSQARPITVVAGSNPALTFRLGQLVTTLSEVVSVGYGTQRREAVTGSVATVNAERANVGVIANANQLLAGRAAGVQVTSNNGEPGGGAQVRIRGGTSITASNEPLYVVDGVPLQNDNAVASGVAIGNSAALARSPLNSINPNDIASITILKDASATAIYGSRGANGVVLIETKKGQAGASQIEYDTYVGAASAARRLDFLTGDQYRSFVQRQITAGNLPSTAKDALGSASTDWERAVERTGLSQNHNLSFSGGSQTTQYRAALNYFDQQGVVIANGLTRYQARVNAQNQALNGRLQTALNLTASRVNNRYAPFDNTAGFSGGLFTNVAVFNPTQPITDPKTGAYYEIGAGSQSVRNPVAMARQLVDRAPENRVLGNLSASYTLLPSLKASTLVGADVANSVRQTYFPLSSPVGAEFNGRARQAERSLQNLNFQQLLTFTPTLGANNDVEVVGGYEFTRFNNNGFEAEVRGFSTDQFQFNNLGAGTQQGSPVPVSYIEQSALASFFSRATYGYKDRYFLTGVLRYDGSSRLAPGNKWSVFPAVSASWNVGEESFMRGRFLTTFKLRAGVGRQGNQAVRPYATQLLLGTDNSARYPFGGQVVTGIGATQVANPNLKWETAQQVNVGVDYGFSGNRFTGTVDLYQKNTKDLLLDVPVAQPAVVSTRIENVGSLRNRGIEASFDAALLNQPNRTVSSGLVLTVERNRVTSLGAGRPFIITAAVSGQGQSGQYAQRLIPGQPIGTFWGAQFLGFNSKGQQLFACSRQASDCVSGQTTTPTGDDARIIGNANPKFALGFRSNANLRRLDVSWLWRAEVGQDVFNNTALVYSTTSNAKQGRNFLTSALNQPDAFGEPAIYSSRWIEKGSFLRLQNVTVGYRVQLPGRLGAARDTRIYVSGDNLLLFTPYSGLDPEVFVRAGDGVSGAASRGVDYLAYPRARTFTVGAHVQF